MIEQVATVPAGEAKEEEEGLQVAVPPGEKKIIILCAATCANIFTATSCVCVWSTEGAATQVNKDHVRADPPRRRVDLQISAAYFFVSNIK